MLKVVQEENESNSTPRRGGWVVAGRARPRRCPADAGGGVAGRGRRLRRGARDQVDEAGHRLVVRNGYHAAREVTTAAGAVPVRAPRVNDKRIDEATGERKRFSSAILPAWARKSPQVAEVLPLLYLHGLSSGDFAPGVGAVPRLGRGPVRGDGHPADRAVARRRRRVRQAVVGRAPTTCTCGSTGSTSRSAWSRTRCACW